MNDQLIETIEKALEAATLGPWIYDETVGDVYAEKTDEIICCANIANAHLIANAPEWLRALLDKIEGMQWKIDAQERVQRVGDDHYREAVKPIKHLLPLENTPGIVQIVEMLQQTREVLEEERRMFGALEYANIDNLMELEQVKAELEKYKGESHE